jgi:DNA segregation ATPase FtsK/SpoIIIE, S-DNA-T family
LLATASLLFLFWQVPADTLDNASGGIIGYELGQSLSQILTIYGATLFLVVFNVVLLTLAFGIKWNRTFSTLKATPAYLQDLFYRNVPESESAFDRTTPSVKKEVIATAPKKSVEETELVEAPAVQEASVKAPQRDYSAEHLFNDMVAKEQRVQEQQVDVDDEAELERTIEKAHQLEQDSQRVVATGEVWRALNSGEDQRHKNDIDALLRAAEEDRPFSPEQHFQAVVQDHTAPIADPNYFQDDAPAQKKNVDWDDDEIFDELLAAVPNGKTATDVHSPFNTPEPVSHLHVVEDPIAVAEVAILSAAASPVALQTAPSGVAKAQFDELDDLDEFLAEDWSEQKVAASDVRTSSSYAQSSAFVQAPIQHHNTVSTSATVAVAKEVLSKEAFGTKVTCRRHSFVTCNAASIGRCNYRSD